MNSYPQFTGVLFIMLHGMVSPDCVVSRHQNINQRNFNSIIKMFPWRNWAEVFKMLFSPSFTSSRVGALTFVSTVNSVTPPLDRSFYGIWFQSSLKYQFQTFPQKNEMHRPCTIHSSIIAESLSSTIIASLSSSWTKKHLP